MPVSPQDFALYSRMTGAPVPTDAATRMQMAPDVYKFTKDFAKKPNILEKSGNLLKNIAKTTLMGAAGLAAAPGLVEQQQTTADNLDQDRTDNQTAKKVVERKGTQYADSQNNKTIAEDVTEDQYLGEPMFRPVQMPSMKPAVGVATPVEMPSMKAAVAPVNEGFADPKRVQKQMESDMVGEPSSLEKVTAFLGQKNLEPVLVAAMEQGKNIEDMVGSGFVGPVQSPLSDNSQSALDGGESTRAQSRDFIKVTEPINVSSSQGTVISPSTKSTPSSDELDSILSKALANKTPQERETVKQKMLRNMNAGREGFMAQDGPNKPAFDAKRRILEKTGKETEAREVGAPNTSDKVNNFLAMVTDMAAIKPSGPRTDIQVGGLTDKKLGLGKSVGISYTPMNGDTKVGFNIMPDPTKPTEVKTYDFTASPEAMESMKDDDKFSKLFNLATRRKEGFSGFEM